MADGFICEYCKHKEDYESWNLYETHDESDDVIYTCSHCGKINVYYVKYLGYCSFHSELSGGPIYEEVKGKGKWGYIDKKGDTAIPHIYDSARDFSNGLASVKKGHKWGVIDKTGREVIVPAYDFIGKYENSLAYFVKNGKYGLIDKRGEVFKPPVNDFIYFSDGIFKMYKDRKTVVVDEHGQETDYDMPIEEGARLIYNPFETYEWLSRYIPNRILKSGECKEFAGSFLCVKRDDGKEGLFEKSGKMILPFIYDKIWVYNATGVINVTKDGKQGLLDLEGKEIIPFIYDGLHGNSEGMILVSNNGKYGFIDEKTLKVAIPLIYNNAERFSEGIAPVKSAEDEIEYESDFWFNNYFTKWGFIDKTGKVILPLIHDKVSKFKDGFAYVEKDYKVWLVDQTGKAILPKVYSNISNFNKDGLARVYNYYDKDTKWGLIDKLGKEIVQPRYDFICDYFEGLAWVEINGMWGFIDMAGNEISLTFYDDFGHFNEGLARTKVRKGMGSSTRR